MTLDAASLEYITSHHQGRLATIGRDGTPQNKPVGYRYNADLGTIDIGGFNMATSAKYRNIAVHPQVAFVIDDAVGQGAAGMRFLELRGHGEQVEAESSAGGGVSGPLIRIHPRRIVSWNIGSGEPTFRSSDLVGDESQDSEPRRPTFGLKGSAGDDATAAVGRLVEELQSGWDRGDADISNRHFATDILWGSPFGATVLGYDDLHAIHVRLKKEGRGGQASRFELVQVIAPTADVAVAQVRRVALDREGHPVEPGAGLSGAFSEMALYVLVRRGRTWWVAAGQNTPIRETPTTS